MDFYPLINSIRIATISTFFTFFLGIALAYYVEKMPKVAKGITDVVLTLPLVLPPTVIGFFLLRLMGTNSFLGSFLQREFGIKIIMNWYSAIFATIVVTFPLMYRTARGAFEAFDENLKFAAQTLGKKNSWIFWRVIMPNCKSGIIAGTVLSFARALGEYGATSMVAGYTPGRTATVSTTVYQLWRTGNETLAYQWVMINVLISFGILIIMNIVEQNSKVKTA